MAEITRVIQTKFDEFISWKKAGESIKPQIPMSEINHLPLAEKPSQEIQFDFIGAIRYETIFLLLSLDRYKRWSAACKCEAHRDKTPNIFLEQYILVTGIPQITRPNKLTAFTGSEVRSTCRSLKIKILYGTPNILTATELVS